MRYCYMMFLLLLGFNTQAQQGYDAGSIPKELLSHARSVIREYEVTIEVKSINVISEHVKYVVTVLNKNGDRDARLKLGYDKIEQIKSIKGLVYNEYGIPVQKFNDHDFSDHSRVDGYSLFEGARYKSFTPAINTYPYTIAYEYDIYSKQTLFLPDWTPNKDNLPGVSVQHSSYKLTCKPDFNIRYKQLNINQQVAESENAGLKSYFWEISNFKAVRDEPFSPLDEQLYPMVKLAPENFSYAGVTGSFTNWQQFGSFICNKLLQNRQTLPPETVQYIKDLTQDIAGPKLKAKKIYEYVQQKTRYVSVQIGIGGYQPFTATEVDQLSYGDCKALVNYMQSLLNAVGIESYYVLNMADITKRNALPDFASMNQFNHVILCMPFKNDTTWVDCTSKDAPFGYLGDFTDDRLVVACTPQGGKLMHTPAYPAATNTQTRNGLFTIDATGNLSGTMTTQFKGTQYDNRDELINETFTEQVKKVKENYPIENLEVAAYTLTQNKSLDPVTTETLKLQARDYMAQNGGRFFFIPNLANRYAPNAKEVFNRTNDVYINRGYTDTDEITYTLPDGFTIKNKPLMVVLNKPFGKYTVMCLLNGRKLTYKRTIQLNNGTYSKDTYADLVDFCQAINSADNYTVTLEKQ